MAYYRIYLLDAQGRITSGIDADCESDATAITRASEAIGTAPDAEIWQQARLVGRLSQLMTVIEEVCGAPASAAIDAAIDATTAARMDPESGLGAPEAR